MPASEELAELFDAYNGIAHDDPAFVANNAEAITDTEKSARAKFEKMLADLEVIRLIRQLQEQVKVTGLVQRSLQ